MSKQVENVIFLVHGIQSHENNWTDIIAKRIKNDPNFEDNKWAVEQGEWGYLYFLFSIFGFVQKRKIEEIGKKLVQIQLKYPNAKINVIAHSYGTMLIYRAMKKYNIHFNKLILVGGIINHYEDFKKEFNNSQIKEIFNFCSYEDKVIRFQPVFGRCGYWGFVRDKKREHYFKPYPLIKLFNYRFKVNHSEYFTEEIPDFYEIWKQLLIRG